jgi:hypothetical protein
MFSLKDVYLIKFKTHLKGSELLTDYTSKKNIPFNLKRVFLTELAKFLFVFMEK